MANAQQPKTEITVDEIMAEEAENTVNAPAAEDVEESVVEDEGEYVNEEDRQRSETEAKAMREGWDPDFKGPAHLKKTAEEFLRDGMHIKKVLKDRNSRLENEITSLRKEYSDTKEMLSKLISFNAEQKERAKRAELEALKAERDNAIFTADVDGVDRVQKKMEALNNEAPDPKEAIRKEFEPAFNAWKTKNPWYDSDAFLSAEADIIADGLLKTGRFKMDQKMLDAVERKMRLQYPDAFTSAEDLETDEENPPAPLPKRRAPTVVTPSRSGGVNPRKTARTFADVPKKDREVFFMQREEIGKGRDGKWLYTEDDFMKEYIFE